MTEAAQPSPAVLVIGAQGVLGSMCVTALRGAGFDVIRAGRRRDDAADFRLIDLDDPDSVERTCSDVDLVVSTVRHAAHRAERFILQRGGVLVSAAVMRPAEKADLISGAEDASGLVVLDAGLSPGVTSLVIKDLLAEHPDADGLEVAGTFSAVEPSGLGAAEDFQYGFSSARRHPTRVVEFAEPFGRRRCLVINDREVGRMLFGSLLGTRDARAYMCMLERPANAQFLGLNALGVLAKVPPALFSFGSRRKLRRMVAKPQAHRVAVTRGGRQLAAADIACTGNYLTTAHAVVAGVQTLIRQRAAGRSAAGVQGFENVFHLSELRDDLEKRGMHIHRI